LLPGYKKKKTGAGTLAVSPLELTFAAINTGV